jgi:predicted RNase H-like nuclease
MLVAGVDGCPRGWIIAIAGVTDGGTLCLQAVVVVPGFKDLLAATQSCAAVAVDIPIGLSNGLPRQADLEARRLLGRPRASSVFPAPLRCLLPSTDYVNACALSYDACGHKLSLQAYGILAKIRDADDALTPQDQRRVCESHPEVSFAMLAGHPMISNKKTLPGRLERATLLSTLLGEDVSLRRHPTGADRDDFYDACVLTWTAARIANGTARSLPAQPQLDARGLRMEIVY